ncbi:helix-turn-helix domain-containing protein [Nucisporomicrobium flavum]|uniref:helix-turn-helix domain-containing protein n=1 Tax=Nucisporomicrobium flavum TaxID=2785915 RepID=UPI0018F4FE4A|nr:helix-turn-helix transcriptional regulator [Nucisporomicrobium flavum]
MPELVGHDPVRRSFARLFLSLRTRAKVTQEGAAKELELGRATINRIEAAEDGVKLPRTLVAAMAELFGCDDKEQQLLFGLAAETRNGRQQSWWQDYTGTEVPAWFSLYLSLEGFAERIRVHFGELLPGLIQDPAYARAVIGVPPDYWSDDEVERRVESRLRRQQMLEGKPPVFEAIGSEGALYRMVGGRDVMLRQIERVLALTERDNVTMRIIPFDAGVHAGMAASDFTLLNFPKSAIFGGAANGAGTNGNGSTTIGNDSIAEPPLAYVETFTGAMYTQTAADVEAYSALWADLEHRALSPEDSRALITTRRKELMR